MKGYEVPLTAIHNPKGDKQFVWVVDESAMTVASREIKNVKPTGHGMRVQGVKPGEWVVTAGVARIQDGLRVLVPPKREGNAP